LQAEQEQREAERRAQEEDLRRSAYQKYGTRDVTLNSDGSMAKFGDRDYVSTEEMKKQLK